MIMKPLVRNPIFSILLLALLIASGCGPSSQSPDGEASLPPAKKAKLADPCEFKAFDQIANPTVKRVFAESETRFQAFQQTYETDPAQALKAWLLSTPTFEGMTEHGVVLKLIQKSGVGHSGIYEVQMTQGGKRDFILKVSTHTNEFGHLWKLQESLVGHPECWLSQTLTPTKTLPAKEQALFPHLPKIYEAAQFPFDAEKETTWYGSASRTHRFPILMEKVAGVPLASLDFTQEKTLTIYRKAGKSLGYFHYLLTADPNSSFERWRSWYHGDLHGNNIFYDEATERFTLIDNDNMKPTRDEYSVYDFYDLDQLAYRVFNLSVQTGHSVLNPLLNELQWQEASNRGMKLGSWYSPKPNELHPYDAVLGVLKSPVWQAQIASSDAYKKVSQRFDRFYAVARGYISAFAPEKHSEIQTYFSHQCKKTADGLARDFTRSNLGDDLEPELVNALRNAFPPNFVRCIDNTLFEN